MFTLLAPWPLPLTRRSLPIAIMAILVLLGGLSVLDRPISAWAQAISPELRGFFVLVTQFGLSNWILIPSLLAVVVLAIGARLSPGWTTRLAMRQLLAVSGFVFLGVGLPGLVANLLKRAIGRGRPEVFNEVGSLHFHSFAGQASYESFPSGHATTAFALCFVVAFLAPRTIWDMLLLSGLIAVSRVIVGAHYPTDIVGGMLVGTLGAYAVRNAFAARGWAFRRAPGGAIVRRRLSAVRRLFSRRRRRYPSAAA